MRGRVDVPVLREMASSRVGVTEGLREGVLVVDHSAPTSDTRPGLPDIDRPLEEARGPAQAALRGRVVSLSFERVHLIRDTREVERMSVPAATDALGRSPLSLAFRPFIRTALKGSSGSTVRIAGTTPRLHNLRCAPRGCCKPIRSCRRDGEKVTAATPRLRSDRAPADDGTQGDQRLPAGPIAVESDLSGGAGAPRRNAVRQRAY